MIAQTEIDFVPVRARAEDPKESHAAAAALQQDQDKIGTSVQIVLAILSKYGECSDFDIRGHWTDFFEGPFSEGLPRMARLWAQRRGIIVQAGTAIHNGRKCRTWRTEVRRGGPDNTENTRTARPKNGKTAAATGPTICSTAKKCRSPLPATSACSPMKEKNPKPNPPMNEPLLHPKQLAAAFGRHPRWVYDLKRAGLKIPATVSEARALIARKGPPSRYRTARRARP